jgi:hypothetical protein
VSCVGYYEIDKCNCRARGYALHVVQDSAAWGHSGYQTYNGPDSMWSLAGIKHLVAGYWPSKDRRTEAMMKSENVVEVFKSGCTIQRRRYALRTDRPPRRDGVIDRCQ